MGLRAVGLLLGLALVFPVSAMLPQPVSAARSCTGWTSTTRPPTSIRVLNHDGKVETVKFRRYVGIVMASGEWPSRLPTALLQAGAVAVKQFAWYHSLAGNHRRGFVTPSGQCYDVLSSTRDQMYAPNRASVTAKQWAAIDATWSLSVRKGGRFFLTQYNAGSATQCGSDAGGRVLKQRSARDCARKGYSARQILRTYYAPNVTFRGAGGGGDGEAEPKPEPKPTPKPTPKPKPRPKPSADARPKAGTQTRPQPRRQAPVAAPTPTPEPEVEVVPWWQIALDGPPPLDEADPLDGALAYAGLAGPADAAAKPAPRRSSAVRVTSLPSTADESLPLHVRAAAGRDAASASSAVSFAGQSLGLAALPGPAGRVVGIYVDGELRALVDMYWPEPYDEVVIFEQDWPAEGLHTVKLQLLGTAEQLHLELDATQLHY